MIINLAKKKKKKAPLSFQDLTSALMLVHAKFKDFCYSFWEKYL